MSAFKCPVCDGQGKLNKPPWIAGDQHEWVSTSTQPYVCHACNGQGFILATDKKEMK